jgi:hypothetical protein
VKDNYFGLNIKNKNFNSGGMVTIEFSRLLNPPDRKPIRRGQMKCT